MFEKQNMIRIRHNEKYIVLLHIKRYPKQNIKKHGLHDFRWRNSSELVSD